MNGVERRLADITSARDVLGLETQGGTASVLGICTTLVTDLPASEVWAGVPAHLLGRKQVRLSLTRPLEETP